MSSLEERWRRVLAGVEEAARSAGRNPADVRLVAVSKFHPAQAVIRLAQLGQLDFGENYMQEAKAKREAVALALPEVPVRWHAIGHMQTNKAKEAAGCFALIHSVDSLRLAEALDKRAPQEGQAVLIQVNIGQEGQKSGVDPAELPALAEAVAQLPHLRLEGLMCLPPNCGEGEAARPYFIRLRNLRDDVERRLGKTLPHLSMGMSGDYVQAVAEGATIVRIGTDIFGPRQS